MLNNLPRKSERVFPATLSAIKANFYLQRKTIARKLGNPRLLKISLHTLRYWKGTMEYHKTRDILYVKELLGHRDIKSTLIYIHLEAAIFQNGRDDEFHVATAKTVEEASKLIALGYEFVHEYQGVMIYRKRK